MEVYEWLFGVMNPQNYHLTLLFFSFSLLLFFFFYGHDFTAFPSLLSYQYTAGSCLFVVNGLKNCPRTTASSGR